MCLSGEQEEQDPSCAEPELGLEVEDYDHALLLYYRC